MAVEPNILRKLFFLDVIQGIFLGAGLMSLINLAAWRYYFYYPTPIEITSVEKEQDYLIGTTVPMTIELEFMDPRDIQKQRSSAYAYTVMGSACHIVMPTGEEIVGIPSTKMADWLSKFAERALAHEILHCLRGFWHGR